MWKPSFNEYGSPNDIIVKSSYNGKNYTTIPQHKYTSRTVDGVKVPSTVTFQLQAVNSRGEKGPITYASHTTSGELIACVKSIACVKENEIRGAWCPEVHITKFVGRRSSPS